MARTCEAVFLFLTFISCAANCRCDEQKLDQTLEESTYDLVDLEEPMSIEILVTGKTGVGKSTLVNALVGEDVAKAGNDVLHVTKAIDRKMSVKNGVQMYIIDTPGLGNADIIDEDVLRTALERSKKIDLFLFCMNILERFDYEQMKKIEAITHIFGKDIWKKGLFVLTFANELNEKEQLSSKLQEWENAMRKRMKSLIDPKVAEKIPIVPAGFKESQLSDRPSWISEFWIQGFQRMGLKTMLLLNRHMSGRANGMKNAQGLHGNPEEQPLVTCHTSKDEKWISPKYIAMTGKLMGGILFSAISCAIPGMGWGLTPILAVAGVYVGSWTAAALENLFWSVKEVDVLCYDEVIIQSLIEALSEGYPEYKE